MRQAKSIRPMRKNLVITVCDAVYGPGAMQIATCFRLAYNFDMEPESQKPRARESELSEEGSLPVVGTRHPREGWADFTGDLGELSEDDLAWLNVPNEADDEWQW